MLRRAFGVIVHANPWILIALIFAAQTAGAIIITVQFRMDFREVAVPISLLIVAALVSGVFRVYDHPAHMESWKWAFPAAVYAAFIFFLSGRAYPDAQVSFDTKLFHPLEYATLAIFFCWMWREVPGKKGIVPFLIRVLTACLFFGISDELHQSFIVERTARSLDVGIDFLGAGAGCGLYLLVAYFRDLFLRAQQESCKVASSAQGVLRAVEWADKPLADTKGGLP